MKKKVEIKLEVDAKVLCMLDIKDITPYCDLSDNNKGCSPGDKKLENFISVVYLDEEVQWSAKVKNQVNPLSPYKVTINSIVFKSGTNIFSEDPFPMENENVTAKVDINTKYLNTLYVYTIKFTVQGPECNKIFEIDPKLIPDT